MSTERMVVQWIGPDGTIFDLGTVTAGRRGLFALSGFKGIGLPQKNFSLDKSPKGGSIVRSIHRDVQRVVLPVFLEGADNSEYLEVERALSASFDSTEFDGPGKIRVLRADGTRREIEAYYEDGFEPEYIDNRKATAVPIFLAADSAWYGVDPVSIVQAYGGTGLDFLNPFPTFSSSLAIGTSTVLNPGTLTAYPEWVITGPASYVSITLDSTSEFFDINPSATAIGHGPLLANESVTVVTTPEGARITGPDGSSWVAAAAWPDSTLWSLPRGTSSITVYATGAGAGTAIAGSFHPRFGSA